MTKIEILLLVLSILIIEGLLLIISLYIKKFSALYKLKTKLHSFSLTENEAQRILTDTNSTTIEKSYAMSCLIVMASILIHILINEGGDYDDKMQEEKFKKNIHSRRIFDELNNTGIIE